MKNREVSLDYNNFTYHLLLTYRNDTNVLAKKYLVCPKNYFYNPINNDDCALCSTKTAYCAYCAGKFFL